MMIHEAFYFAHTKSHKHVCAKCYSGKRKFFVHLTRERSTIIYEANSCKILLVLEPKSAGYIWQFL